MKVDDTVDIGGQIFTKYTQDAATILVDNDVDQSAIGTVVAAIDLDDVAAGTGGFKIIGQNADDNAGSSVSAAGGVNGDGFADVIVGAYGNDAGGGAAGAAYVVFGAASGITAVDLDAVALGTGGYKITGEIGIDRAGYSVSSAGDVDGDGLDDLIVGAFGNDEGDNYAGAAYVVFSAAGITAVNLDDVANGTGGFKIIGEASGDKAGYSVSNAGDVNGDGFDDLIVGAYRSDTGGVDAGAAYVVFGAASGITSVDLDAIALGTGGFKILAEMTNDNVGNSVSAAGDVNGDGFADVIVGARLQPGGANIGAAYVMFGAASGITEVDLVDVANGTGGFKITGEALGDIAGGSVDSAGDVNGDGFDDLIVGAFSNDGGINGGAAYVVFGAASGITSVGLDSIALGTGGFKITGEYGGGQAGYTVSSAGDVNGDGFDDLLVGARLNDAGGHYAGAAYVVFGAAASPTAVDLADIAAGIGGFKVIGEDAEDQVGGGQSVSSAGDVDGDGFDDLIVGARYNGADGAAYVVFGADFTG